MGAKAQGRKRVKTVKKTAKEIQGWLDNSGMEAAITPPRYKLLRKIAFLCANNEIGKCFATKITLAKMVHVGRSTLYNQLNYLIKNGLVIAESGPHPTTGKERTLHCVNFAGCEDFELRYRVDRLDKKEIKAEKAREGRRKAQERKREEMKAELLAEVAAEADALRAKVEEEERRLEELRAEREREEILRDAIRSEADSVKQERDQARAEREEIRAQREEEDRDLSRLDSSQIMDRFDGLFSKDERVEMLKWAVNQNLPADNQVNGDFDPKPLITEYGGLKGAMEHLLGVRKQPAISVN